MKTAPSIRDMYLFYLLRYIYVEVFKRWYARCGDLIFKIILARFYDQDQKICNVLFSMFIKHFISF